MLRDKQSGRADEHLLNNKTPGNIKKKKTTHTAILILLPIFCLNIVIMYLLFAL